jgi:hypothetical protein
MQIKTSTISVDFSGKNKALLSSRTYSNMWTEMKNSALPRTMREELNLIYKSLVGTDLSEIGFTFLIKATSDGTFDKIYSPSLYRLDDKLVIDWGGIEIPLDIDDKGMFSTLNRDKSCKFAFKNIELNDYKTETLSVTVRSGDLIITMPIPLRFADYKNPGTAELFTAYLEDQNISSIGAYLTDFTAKGKGDNVFRPEGFLIKESALPVGEYTVHSYWEKETAYGPKYYMTVKVNESFTGLARVKDNETWSDKEVEVTDWAIVNANSGSSRVLSARPIIDLENPAKLTVFSHSITKKGLPSCKSQLTPVGFDFDEDSISLDF